MDQTYSPYSILGIAKGVAGAYNGAVDHTAEAMLALHNTFGRPGFTPPTPAPAPVVAPAPVPMQPAPTIGGAIGAIQQHQQDLANMANGGPVSRARGAISRLAGGGVIQGPGTGTSDSIPTTMPTGGYVMPADSTQQVQRPVNVSSGETALTPDQVHAVGQAALDALKGVTHRTVRPKRRKGPVSQLANGGPAGALTSIGAPFSMRTERQAGPALHPHPVMSRANGGPVDDSQDNTVRAVLPKPAGSQMASQIPGYDGPVPAADGSHDTALGGTAGEILNTVNAVGPALGPMGAAGSRIISGIASAGRAAAALPLVSTLAPAAPVAALYGGLAAAGSDAPRTPAMPSAPAAATPNPTDTRLASGTQGDPAAAPAAAPAGAGQGTGIPGVYRFVDPSGRALYTDNPNGGQPGAPASISPQNSQAADALSDRYDTEARAAAMGPSAAASLPAGYGITTPQDTGGYGILDNAYQAKRLADWAKIDDAHLAAKTGRAGASAISQSIASQAGLGEEAMREAGATGRTGITEGGQTQRERENNAAMLQREGPTRYLANMEQATKLRGAIGLMSAQDSYRQALATGDQTKISAAEDALRAAQGHWERNYPELYSTTAIPSQMNPDGTRSSPGAIVTDKRTGQVRIIGAGEWGGGQQPNPMPQSKDKLVAGQTYQTARGPARWDGNQFVQ